MKKTKKFIINAIILTATSLLLRTISVSFNVYISQKIGAEGMGIFQLIMSIYMFAVTLAISGIGLTTTRLVAEELAKNSHSGIKSAVRKCIYYSIFFSLLSAILMYINADFIATYWLHGKISATPIMALAISLPFLGMTAVFGGYFTAVRRVIKSSSAQILEQVIRIAITIYGVSLLAPKGLDYACLAVVLGGAIAEISSFIYLLILFLFDKRRYKNKTNVDKKLTKRMFSIGLPVAFSSYIRSALGTFKQIIIPSGLERSGMSCDLSIAQYGIIRGMVMPILMFPSALLSAFSSLLIPELAEKAIQNNHKSIQYIISRIFKITLLFSICVSGILLFYSDELSMAIYHNLDSALYIRTFAPLIVIMYFDEIVDAILKGLNEQVSVVGINIFDTIVSIILLYTLLPKYGILGYVIVIFISETLNGYLSIKRLIKVTQFDLKFISWFFVPILIITISVLCMKIFTTIHLALQITFVVCIYLLILYGIGSLSKEDFKM